MKEFEIKQDLALLSETDKFLYCQLGQREWRFDAERSAEIRALIKSFLLEDLERLRPERSQFLGSKIADVSYLDKKTRAYAKKTRVYAVYYNRRVWYVYPGGDCRAEDGNEFEKMVKN